MLIITYLLNNNKRVNNNIFKESLFLKRITYCTIFFTKVIFREKIIYYIIDIKDAYKYCIIDPLRIVKEILSFHRHPSRLDRFCSRLMKNTGPLPRVDEESLATGQRCRYRRRW